MKAKHKYTETTNPAPDTGKMLDDYIKAKRIHQAALSRVLGRRANTIAEYKKRPSIQTAILWELSHVLKHNFFAEISAQLPTTYTSNIPPDTALADKITELELALKEMTAERDVLMVVIKGKG